MKQLDRRSRDGAGRWAVARIEPRAERRRGKATSSPHAAWDAATGPTGQPQFFAALGALAGGDGGFGPRGGHVPGGVDRRRLALWIGRLGEPLSEQQQEGGGAGDQADQRHPHVQALTEELIGGVDSQRLDVDPAERVERHVQGEDRSGRDAVPEALDEPPQDEEHQQVPQRLVQERGHERVWAADDVVRKRGIVDLDRPWLGAGTAVQLLVEVVAPPAQRLGQDQPGSDAVGHHPERQLGPAHTDQRADHATQDSAPDAQPTLPDLGNLAVVTGRERAPVGDHVVEPRPHQAERHRPHGDRVHQFGIDLAPSEFLAGDPARKQHRQRQDQPIPARLQAVKTEQKRVAGTGDREQLHRAQLRLSASTAGGATPSGTGVISVTRKGSRLGRR